VFGRVADDDLADVRQHPEVREHDESVAGLQ
jgi:hypothetical protein